MDPRIARLRRGDPAAFDAIYDELRPRVYSFLVRLSKRRDLAEELLQDTFVRLASHASSLAEDTKIAAWLFTVARNLYVSHMRLTMLEADRLHQISLEPAAVTPTPFELAAANETQARLERALASIPETYREVLLLVAVEHLEPSEAAKVVGISPEALRQRLTRARAMLKTALHPEQDEERRGASHG